MIEYWIDNTSGVSGAQVLVVGSIVREVLSCGG